MSRLVMIVLAVVAVIILAVLGYVVRKPIKRTAKKTWRGLVVRSRAARLGRAVAKEARERA